MVWRPPIKIWESESEVKIEVPYSRLTGAFFVVLAFIWLATSVSTFLVSLRNFHHIELWMVRPLCVGLFVCVECIYVAYYYFRTSTTVRATRNSLIRTIGPLRAFGLSPKVWPNHTEFMPGKEVRWVAKYDWPFNGYKAVGYRNDCGYFRRLVNVPSDEAAEKLRSALERFYSPGTTATNS